MRCLWARKTRQTCVEHVGHPCKISRSGGAWWTRRAKMFTRVFFIWACLEQQGVVNPYTTRKEGKLEWSWRGPGTSYGFFWQTPKSCGLLKELVSVVHMMSAACLRALNIKSACNIHYEFFAIHLSQYCTTLVRFLFLASHEVVLKGRVTQLLCTSFAFSAYEISVSRDTCVIYVICLCLLRSSMSV